VASEQNPRNINSQNVNARNINARNINARNIKTWEEPHSVLILERATSPPRLPRRVTAHPDL
jgi:hypothetical protein